MLTERKIFKNTVLLSSGKVFGDLCSFLFLVYFGRFFGAATLGKYSFAMSFAGLLTIVTSFGFNSLLIREVSKDEDKSPKFLGNLIIIRGVSSFFVWLLIGLGSYLSNLPSDSKVILFLICGYHIFYRLTGLLNASFRAHDLMHYSAILEFYHKLLILILGICCILFFNNPIIALSSYPLSAGTMLILAAIFYMKKFGRPVFTLDYHFIKNSVVKGFPFFFIIIIGQVYDRIGIVFLTFLKGEAVTGLFSASDRILVTLNAGIVIFSGVLFPYMSKISSQSKEKLEKLSERAIRFISIVLIFLVIVIFISSEKIILLTFGDQYSESVQILKILVWSLMFTGLNYILSNLLIVNYKEKKLLRIRVVAYLFYCLFSFMAIWKWSFIGLASAKISVEAILFFITIFIAFKTEKALDLFKQMFIPVASGILSITLFFFIKDQGILFTLPAVICFYTMTLFIFKGIYIHDLLFLKEIVIGGEISEVR